MVSESVAARRRPSARGRLAVALEAAVVAGAAAANRRCRWPSARRSASWRASAGARPPLQRNKSFHSHVKRSEEARLVVALAGHPEEADLLSATGCSPGSSGRRLYLLPPPPHSGQGVLAQALEAGASPDELWNCILVSPSATTRRRHRRRAGGRQRMAELRWRDVLVNGRGALGENALHLCLRQTNVPVLRRLAKLLLTPGGIRGGGPLATAARVQKLANSAYEGAQHRGLSCLHLAVLANDLPILRALLRAGARLDGPVARGHFWYQSGNVYFGGSAIGLAASAGRANALAVLLAQPGAAAAASLADADPFAEAEMTARALSSRCVRSARRGARRSTAPSSTAGRASLALSSAAARRRACATTGGRRRSRSRRRRARPPSSAPPSARRAC